MITHASRIEWEAWQALVAELKNKGIDINHEHALYNAIKTWGERYSEFRKEYGLVKV